MSTINIIGSFTDEGAPKTGLTPIVGAWEMDGTVSVNPVTQTMTEIGNGLYYYSWTTYDETKDYAIRLDSDDGTMSDSDRYKFGTNDQSGDFTAVKLPTNYIMGSSDQTDLDTLIKDIPTVAEFNARSIVAADYTIVADLGVVQTADHTAGIAAVKAETVLIVADTNELQGDWENTGRLDTLVDSIITDIGNLNNIAVADITGVEVDNDGTAISLAGAFKLILSTLSGESSGGGTTTITFRDIADTKDRVVVTVDANGNRTNIGTRDAT